MGAACQLTEAAAESEFFCIMTQSQWNHQEAAENRRLAALLWRILRDAGVAAAQRRDFQILDLACGECREAETLVRVVHSLAEDAEAAVPQVRLLGADIRNREVTEAKQRFRSRADAQFEFLAADASRLEQHRQINADFDLTFLRHQNFWHDPAVWRRIFVQGLERLHEAGHLVITSYFDREHALAIKALEEIGAELVVTERHAESIALTSPGKSVDRHVAVFRKKRQ